MGYARAFTDSQIHSYFSNPHPALTWIYIVYLFIYINIYT